LEEAQKKQRNVETMTAKLILQPLFTFLRFIAQFWLDIAKLDQNIERKRPRVQGAADVS
jgi:hypothetical protein